MQINKEQLATIIATLRDKSKYSEIEKGYFRKVPSLQGFLYTLPKLDILDEYRIYLIVNTASDFKYPKEKTEIENYTFLIFNASDFDSFAKNVTIVATKLSEVIEELAEKVQEERDKDLPYGYIRDEEGNIQVDPQKANEVRNIYKMYIETRSMKKIAKELKTNFSHVRDVLRDERYDDFSPRIISPSLFKQVEAISFENQKNKVTKADKSLMGEIKKEIKSKVKGVK